GSLEPRASTEACHELLSDVERLPLAGKARVWLVCVKAHFSEVRRGYECANEVLGSHNGTSAHQLSHAHSLVLWRGNSCHSGARGRVTTVEGRQCRDVRHAGRSTAPDRAHLRNHRCGPR